MRVGVHVIFLADEGAGLGEDLDDRHVGVEYVHADELVDADFVGKVAIVVDRGEQAEVVLLAGNVVIGAVTGSDVEIILYCPAATMQLKEVHTHVRWPGEQRVRPLSEFSDRVRRLTDLERSYRDLWKFYVFVDTDDPNQLRIIQDVVSEEIPEANNVYRIEDAN